MPGRDGPYSYVEVKTVLRDAIGIDPDSKGFVCSVDSHIIPTKILGLIQIISHPSTKSLYHYPFPESPKAFHF
jgi:hypothetical protein